MRGRDWLLSLAGPVDVDPRYRAVDWSDVLLTASEKPDPAGWLARQMGVTRDTGLSYLRAVKPGTRSYSPEPTHGRTGAAAQSLIGRLQADADRQAEQEARDRGDRIRRGRIAAALRRIEAVDVGTVKIEELSGPRQGDEGYRNVGYQEVDLEAAATAVDHGSWTLAEDRLSEAIMDAYGEGLGSVLDIIDYPEGIEGYE